MIVILFLNCVFTYFLHIDQVMKNYNSHYLASYTLILSYANFQVCLKKNLTK